MRLTTNYTGASVRKLSDIVAFFEKVDALIRTRPLFMRLVNDLGESEEDISIHWIIANDTYSEEDKKAGYYRLRFELCKTTTTSPGFTVLAHNWKYVDESHEELVFKGPLFPNNDLDCADFVLSCLGEVIPSRA